MYPYLSLKEQLKGDAQGASESAGFNVVTFDLRSHGLSERVDDIRGYAKDVHDFATDSIAMLEFAQQQNAGLPCFFWGESFGGVSSQITNM